VKQRKEKRKERCCYLLKVGQILACAHQSATQKCTLLFFPQNRDCTTFHDDRKVSTHTCHTRCKCPFSGFFRGMNVQCFASLEIRKHTPYFHGEWELAWHQEYKGFLTSHSRKKMMKERGRKLRLCAFPSRWKHEHAHLPYSAKISFFVILLSLVFPCHFFLPLFSTISFQ
jgi:hypothetical protein